MCVLGVNCHIIALKEVTSLERELVICMFAPSFDKWKAICANRVADSLTLYCTKQKRKKRMVLQLSIKENKVWNLPQGDWPAIYRITLFITQGRAKDMNRALQSTLAELFFSYFCGWKNTFFFLTHHKNNKGDIFKFRLANDAPWTCDEH